MPERFYDIKVGQTIYSHTSCTVWITQSSVVYSIKPIIKAIKSSVV